MALCFQNLYNQDILFFMFMIVQDRFVFLLMLNYVIFIAMLPGWSIKFIFHF